MQKILSNKNCDIKSEDAITSLFRRIQQPNTFLLEIKTITKPPGNGIAESVKSCNLHKKGRLNKIKLQSLKSTNSKCSCNMENKVESNSGSNFISFAKNPVKQKPSQFQKVLSRLYSVKSSRPILFY